MYIGNKLFDFDNKAFIMGILNVTPDSFSDGGKFNNIDDALKRVDKMLKDGASIIDIGGESTRPGYEMISDEEEIERIVPVIEKVKSNFDCVISTDTYKANVLSAAIDAGCDLANDIWGLKYDNEYANVVAKGNIPVCIMHNGDGKYNSFVDDVIRQLNESINIALNAGIDRDKIILDPGVGFAKSYEENLKIIKDVDRICDMGYPVLLGTSRKSVIGLTLDLPVTERLEGTIATTVMGYLKGCRIFRVHDVLENKRALDMAEAIYNS